MVDHLQSRVTPWRQYASHVKVRGTLSKMDVSDRDLSCGFDEQINYFSEPVIILNTLKFKIKIS